MVKWQKTKIGEFLFERKGKYKPNDKAIAGLMRIEKIDFSGNFHIAQKPSRTNMILICPDDLVISGINVSKGAMGIYHGDEDVTATIHYSSYTFDTAKIDVEYFKRFLKSAEFIRLLQEQVKGGIKTEIKPKHILSLEINLPDIAEQRKTVTYFKSIETEDGELKHELTHQQTLLKKLRQQILQEAIEGRLTNDWRTQNPDVEPASELLARIQAEKEQLIKDKKIKEQKPLPAISEDEKPFELPESWVWCRIRNIASISSGKGFTKSEYSHNGMRLFQIANVSFGKTSWVSTVYIPMEYLKQYPSLELKKGDIVMALNRPLLGKRLKIACLNEADVPSILYQRVGRFDFFSNSQREWTYTYLKAPEFSEWLYDQIKGVNIPFVNQTKVYIHPIPLPPLAEQKAIVAKVEKLLALCDQLETQITHNQSHADGLMQAVLKEAFIHSNESSEKVLVNT